MDFSFYFYFYLFISFYDKIQDLLDDEYDKERERDTQRGNEREREEKTKRSKYSINIAFFAFFVPSLYIISFVCASEQAKKRALSLSRLNLHRLRMRSRVIQYEN